MKSELYRTQDGVEYRDLNKNGRMDPYEDPRIPIEERIDDLLSQMTIEEKAGMLFINGAAVNADGSIEDNPDQPGFAIGTGLDWWSMSNFISASVELARNLVIPSLISTGRAAGAEIMAVLKLINLALPLLQWE
jgi:hypothetical protein